MKLTKLTATLAAAAGILLAAAPGTARAQHGHDRDRGSAYTPIKKLDYLTDDMLREAERLVRHTRGSSFRGLLDAIDDLERSADRLRSAFENRECAATVERFLCEARTNAERAHRYTSDRRVPSFLKSKACEAQEVVACIGRELRTFASRAPEPPRFRGGSDFRDGRGYAAAPPRYDARSSDSRSRWHR